MSFGQNWGQGGGAYISSPWNRGETQETLSNQLFKEILSDSKHVKADDLIKVARGQSKFGESLVRFSRRTPNAWFAIASWEQEGSRHYFMVLNPDLSCERNVVDNSTRPHVQTHSTESSSCLLAPACASGQNRVRKHPSEEMKAWHLILQQFPWQKLVPTWFVSERDR